MRTATQQLEAVLQLLEMRGWTRRKESRKFYLYGPPGNERHAAFELLVPRLPSATDFDKAITNCIDAIASFYGLPFASVEALLLPASEVMSVRLQGEGFVGGAAPFPRFERTLEHLKRTISRAAAFIVTDDPLAQRVPIPARNFVEDCWFLQTARGSFVTRVALPTTGSFSALQYSLWGRAPQKAEVVASIRKVADLVGRRVLAGDDEVFTDKAIEDVRSTASVALLEEFGKLLRSPEAERIDLTFSRGTEETAVEVPDLSDARLRRLDEYVGFIREKLHASVDIDVVGRVFEVRRSRRGSHSFIGLEATLDERPEYITFKIEQGSLHVMLEHLRSRAPLRVRGRARRLRTQIRIEQDFQFEE